MLCVKRSTDLKRQWVIRELGLLLCQNEAKEAASIKKAKVVHSWEVLDAKVDCGKAVLDAKTDCTKAVLEAKSNYWVAVQEAKTVRGNQLQKAKTAYSKALGEATAVKLAQSTVLHREHVRLMQELEEQAIREESKIITTSFPPARPSCIMLHKPSRRIWLPLTMSCWGDHLHHLHLLHLPGHPWWENSYPWLPLPSQYPNSPQGQKGGILCQSHGGAHL